jgi:hypothetical protein
MGRGGLNGVCLCRGRGLEREVQERGLEVHGVIVGNEKTHVMKELCTHLHVFKSWSSVKT